MRPIFFLICLLILPYFSYTQSEVEISAMFLEHKDLGPLNFETREFAKWGGKLSALLKAELKREKAPFELLVMTHFKPDGNATTTIHTRPEIPDNSVFIDALLAKAERIPKPIPQFTSLTVITLAKVNGGIEDSDMNYTPVLTFPKKKIQNQFREKTLEEKHWAIQNYAVTELIPLLGEIAYRMDDQYQGIRSMGTNLSYIKEVPSLSDVKQLTDHSSTYWRALIEMNSGDQLIPAMKISMHAAAGDLDYANRLLSSMLYFSKPSTLPHYLLEELDWRFELFYEQLRVEVEYGIKLEERKKIDEALAHLKSIEKEFPRSAWLNYELYYTLNDKRLQEHGDPSDFALWDSMAPLVFNADPMYPAEVAVRNADEAYELYLRNRITELFKNKNTITKDLIEYANIALDLEAYSFAAHVYWNLIDSGADKSLLSEFLYCLTQLGDRYTVNSFSPAAVQSAQQVKQKREAVKHDNEYYKMYAR